MVDKKALYGAYSIHISSCIFQNKLITHRTLIYTEASFRKKNSLAKLQTPKRNVTNYQQIFCKPNLLKCFKSSRLNFCGKPPAGNFPASQIFFTFVLCPIPFSRCWVPCCDNVNSTTISEGLMGHPKFSRCRSTMDETYRHHACTSHLEAFLSYVVKFAAGRFRQNLFCSSTTVKKNASVRR